MSATLYIFEPVRQIAKASLEDATTGFNALYAAVAASRSDLNLPLTTIDWATGSTSFRATKIARDSEDVYLSRLFPNPLSLVMYTGEGGTRQNKGTTHVVYSGPVWIALDFYVRLRLRDGSYKRALDNTELAISDVELDGSEDVMDVIQECAINALYSSPQAGSITFGGDFVTDRSSILYYEDGFMQRVSVDAEFNIIDAFPINS